MALNGDMIDALLDEKARVNNAVDDGDIFTPVQDYRSILGELVGLTESLAEVATTAPHHYDDDSYSLVVMADTPAWYLRLSDFWTPAIDFTGGGNSASINGPGVGAGVPVQLRQAGPMAGPAASFAALFDGASGWASMAAASQPGDVFSFECWFKRVKTGALQYIYDAGTNGLAVLFDATDHITVAKKGGANGFVSTAAYTDIVSWHHLVVTKAATAAPVVYLDNVAIAGTTAAITLASSGLAPYIGAVQGGAASYYGGLLDEIASYPSALSAARVTAHYNAGVAVTVQPNTAWGFFQWA